jgi:hypothetical protein
VYAWAEAGCPTGGAVTIAAPSPANDVAREHAPAAAESLVDNNARAALHDLVAAMETIGGKRPTERFAASKAICRAAEKASLRLAEMAADKRAKRTEGEVMRREEVRKYMEGDWALEFARLSIERGEGVEQLLRRLIDETRVRDAKDAESYVVDGTLFARLEALRGPNETRDSLMNWMITEAEKNSAE